MLEREKGKCSERASPKPAPFGQVRKCTGLIAADRNLGALGRRAFGKQMLLCTGSECLREHSWESRLHAEFNYSGTYP